MSVEKLREEIDEIDLEILKLLNERARKALEIAKIKEKEGKGYYSPEREKIVVDKLTKLNKGPIPNKYLKEIFKSIINCCLSLQRKLRVVYFGPPATFTHLAAIRNFGPGAEYIPVKNIREVFATVEKGKADYGVVPIENSTEGIVSHTLDMFLDSDLKICAEVILEIAHHLVGKGRLEDVRKVYSHPQAIAQCRMWLEEHLPSVEICETESTAKAAQLAAEEEGACAIASEVAAALYGLDILEEHIEDSPHNYTRFLVIGREYTEKSGDDKTSILFSIRDRVGALYEMLAPFREHGINLTKIESRPTKKKAWEYVFFVDFEGHKDDEEVKKALSELEEKCFFLKILGSYPKGE
ncbi:MAG TPA: prephenate dehydratase [Candidatus Aerophobetes bacterium]|uniref:Bifunctional chorismate mutase/prephenate dehydratase n=1 Tax=Aerophobetes bacterium TaxID=2030807 RepID=A0A7V5LZH9_UNCAE|nr:prephenate dehydratase [Candidatus Aerophobetes bacterium]